MENQISNQQDEELEEATKGLEPHDGSVEEEKFEDIGEIKPEEPQVPEVDLKPLPKGLKYEFLGPDKTYPVIVSDELSPEENEALLILLKKHRKVIGYSSRCIVCRLPESSNSYTWLRSTFLSYPTTFLTCKITTSSCLLATVEVVDRPKSYQVDVLCVDYPSRQTVTCGYEVLF
jgi:hypothetical protein